ncbi:MAG: hypothetical protein LBL13_10345 [Bacteroidales bacterium]|jgi:very-short-patch-repair endonuclease|nr:hypothetical protein [Bacteroidales bacterium]
MEAESIKRCEICDNQLDDGYKQWPKCPSCHANIKEMRALIDDIQERQSKKGVTREITPEQKKLYLALKARNWDPELEHEDEYKTVDIAILAAKLYIEVNGSQHANNPNQLKSDLWRSYYSFRDGFLTLPVFNIALNDAEFHQIVNIINDIAKERKQAIKNQQQDNCS